MRILPELIQGIEKLLPPVLLVPLAIIAAPFIVWAWLRWLRAKQIRGALRTAFLITDPDRHAAALQRAFDIAGTRESGLVALLDAAHQTGQVDAMNRAMNELEARGLGAKDVARVRHAVKPPKHRAGHPVEEAVVIERFIEQEMFDAASKRLVAALGRFPADPDLLELQATLHAAQQADSPQAGSLHP